MKGKKGEGINSPEKNRQRIESALVFSVINLSEGGNERKRSHSTDTEEDSDSDPTLTSAVYRKENKIPVDRFPATSTASSSATARKRKASPPKQSRILSKEEMKSMYPTMSFDDDWDKEDDDVTPIKPKVRNLLTHRLFCLVYL